MYNQEEVNAKVASQYAYQNTAQAQTAGTTSGGLTGCDYPKRENLRERLNYRLVRAYRDADKLAKTQELAALLDKNPEVARILDLVEELGRD